MKYLFIRPPINYSKQIAGRRYSRKWPPLDLLNCAAIVRRKEIDPDILDYVVDSISHYKSDKLIRDADLIFVTTSALDRWQCPEIDIKTTIDYVKSLPTKKTLLMGAHGTINASWLLQTTGVKGVIRAEPEGAIKKLAEGQNIREIAGVSFVSGDEIIENRIEEPLDIKTFPIPAYDLINIDKYSYAPLGERLALLETTRGCTYACAYCFKKMYGNKHRAKDADQISREINYAINDVGVSSIYFFDLEFTYNKSIVRHVCDIIAKSGKNIRWCCQTRPDLVDHHLLARMKESGCQLIHYGVESGTARMLEMINKRIRLSTVSKTISETHAVGIDTACFFLMGFPTETENEIHETIRYAKLLNSTYASFHIVTPYPGTSLSQYALGGDLIPRYVKSDIKPNKMERLARWAFISYYARLNYLSKHFMTIIKRMRKSILRMLWEYLR
jgi:anaerobic magnesium-protoporphyrin IX monomethyl ester cyclase